MWIPTYLILYKFCGKPRKSAVVELFTKIEMLVYFKPYTESQAASVVTFTESSE